MAQNQCSPEEAFKNLRAASSHRNEKLHTVAESIVSHLSGTSITNLQFDE
jgi:AmiR/NasT family two-component response regulator